MDYSWDLVKARLEERWAEARLRALRREAHRNRPTDTQGSAPIFYFWRKDSS